MKLYGKRVWIKNTLNQIPSTRWKPWWAAERSLPNLKCINVQTILMKFSSKKTKPNLEGTYFLIQAYKAWLIKRQITSHENKENNSARPNIRWCTIITFIFEHLIIKISDTRMKRKKRKRKKSCSNTANYFLWVHEWKPPEQHNLESRKQCEATHPPTFWTCQRK